MKLTSARAGLEVESLIRVRGVVCLVVFFLLCCIDDKRSVCEVLKICWK